MSPRWTAALVTGLALIAPATHAAAEEFAPLTEDGLPNVQAESAIVVDRKSGGIFYEKNPDEVRAIASTGKIFVAMVARAKEIDLEGVTEITRVDRDYARGGSRTRLPVGRSYKNIDLLRAMLIASDNRAPTAIGRAVGLDPDQLIAAMNELADELGLVKTEFTDPTGLNGNVSTAREMVYALEYALKDPVLAEIMATDKISVHSVEDGSRRIRTVHYRNTNRIVRSARWTATGGKTGYTSPAGYCLVTAAVVDGREVFFAFYGTHGKLTRYGDFGRVANWMISDADPQPKPGPPRPKRVMAGSGEGGAVFGASASGYGKL